MKFIKRRWIFFSLLLNIVFILAVGFVSLKRLNSKKDPVLASYLDNPQYIEQTNIETAYNGTAKIIILGNSHVYKVHWNELLNRGDVANRGIGGDITKGYLNRLQYIFNAKPSICFIEGGANDIYYNIAEDSSIANLSTLVDTLQEAGIIPVLHTIPPYTDKEPSNYLFNEKAAGLNKKIKALSRQKTIDCIDLYTLLSEKNILRSAYSQPDGTHLSGKAYLLWKNEINTLLLKHKI